MPGWKWVEWYETSMTVSWPLKKESNVKLSFYRNYPFFVKRGNWTKEIEHFILLYILSPHTADSPPVLRWFIVSLQQLRPELLGLCSDRKSACPSSQEHQFQCQSRHNWTLKTGVAVRESDWRTRLYRIILTVWLWRSRGRGVTVFKSFWTDRRIEKKRRKGQGHCADPWREDRHSGIEWKIGD